MLDLNSGGGDPQWEEQWFALGGNYRTAELTIWPSVDIDTDSDNNRIVNRSLDEDVIEDHPDHLGKRIFVNWDDDNENGKADVEDAVPLTSPDEDLAEAKLDFGLSTYAGVEAMNWFCTIRRRRESGARLKRSWRVPNTIQWQTYTWTIGSGWIKQRSLPMSVYVEGIEVAASTLTWTLQPHGGAALARTLSNSASKHCLALPQQKYPNWNERTTSDWNGIKLAPAWYIDKALVDYVNTPQEKGLIQTIHPDKTVDGVPTRSNVGANELSSTAGPTEVGGEYPYGFVMEFDYSFETARNPDWGYIQAEGKLPKLSFVGNSGVKFGVLQSTGAPLETAILDVKSMVRLGGNLTAFDPSRGGIDDDGIVTIPIQPPDPATYQPEPLNRLMTGVIYGGDYRGMADNPSHLLVPPADPADAYEYYATLSNNYNRTNAHMKIDVARVNETVYGVNIYMDYSTVSCHSDYVRMTGPMNCRCSPTGAAACLL